MAGELRILDDRMEQELLSLEPPLAFIDFEAFTNVEYLIPGTITTDTIPCQWSCHILNDHCPGGEGWEGNIEHYEYLWEGDVGWSPIYSFVQSLYDATYNAATILVWSPYESRCLNTCKQLALNDWNAMQSGLIPEDYVIVNSENEKVLLTEEIVNEIQKNCNSMLERLYDMCPVSYNAGGVRQWLQSEEFGNSNSIKHVLPVAMKEYSRTEELLASEGLPTNGYEGLSGISNGAECTRVYSNAINRPPREGVDILEPGNAPFDPDVEYQCLIYCRLDTLAMVIVYLAVMEATEKWRLKGFLTSASYVEVAGSDFFHALDTGVYYKYMCPNCQNWLDYDDDSSYGKCPTCDEEFDLYELEPTRVFYTLCNPYTPHIMDSDIANVQWMYETEFQQIPLRELYSRICPECRRINNSAL